MLLRDEGLRPESLRPGRASPRLVSHPDIVVEARGQVDADSLAGRIAEDLEGAFEDVVVAFQDALFGFAFGLCGDAGTAEDIVQDAFIRAYRALRTYDAGRRRDLRLRPWLFRVTLNVFRNKVRAKRPAIALMDRMPEVAASPQSGPEVEAERSWERSRLLDGLSQLPASYRTAVVLKYIRDWTYADIAEVLERPVGTIKADVHRGVKMLRTAMCEEVAR